MNAKHTLIVKSKRAPIVTIDPASDASYVYFQDPKKKVFKTLNRFEKNGVIINVDLDLQGEVVGVECIGMNELVLTQVMDKAKLEAPQVDFSRTRFRAASHLIST